jgi:hypothetical protein
MFSNSQLCTKINSIFPDIGRCGIDLNVEYDSDNEMWAVGLKARNRSLKTYISREEAEACMEGKQCVSLGLQIAQLRENAEKL